MGVTVRGKRTRRLPQPNPTWLGSEEGKSTTVFFLDNGNDGRPRYICRFVGSASQLPTGGLGCLSLALHRMR